MNNFFALLWRAMIPLLWLVSVLAAFWGGFQPGRGPIPPPGQTYSYPWPGVILTSVVTTLECAFLYLVLRPDRLVRSLARVAAAFAVFFVLSIFFFFTTATDQFGYAYVPGNFTRLLTFLLFILLVLTATAPLTNRYSPKGQAK